MTMHADEALINAVYCQVQCLGCTDWRSDRVKAAIGKYFILQSLACEKVTAPPRCTSAARTPPIRPPSRT